MTLNDLLNGEIVCEDAFIELNSENEFIDSLMSRENDARVIDQYLKIDENGICSGCYKDCCNCFYEDNEPAIGINNDLRVMLDYDKDLFELYYWELYVNYQYCRYVLNFGFSFTQAKRLLKITKIKKIMNGK